VARRLADGESTLLAAASARDVERWAEQVGAADPFLSERLTALGGRLGRPAETPAGPGAGGGIRTHWLRLRFPGARLVGALTALLVFVLGYVVPTPAGLSRPGLAALGAIVATVPLLVCAVLPDYVVMLLLTLALVLPGHVPAGAMLGGFSTPAWIMILTLLAVGTAVSRSGLMLRLVLVSLQRLPPTFLTQSLVLSATGILMTAGLTSGATRIALGVPIARGIADAMGFARQSPGAAAIGLLTFFTFLEMGELFLTGTFTGLVVHDLLPRAARSTITWWRWSLVALPTFMIIFGLVYATLLFLFKPHRQARVNLRAIQLQQSLLGPLTRNEIWSAVALVVLLVGFATREAHGIAPAWLSVAVFLGLFMLGTMDQTALQAGGILGLLVYSGVTLSLSNVFGALEIDAWLTSLVQSGMPTAVRNPYGFVFVISLLAFALHFFVPWMTATTLIALVTMPLAEGLGFHPFIPVFVALVAGDHTIVPYVNSGYAILYFASEGELFSHAQARWPLVLETLFRMAALLASVPVWHLMGLM
jgi:di/tricarboxylate transporter